MSKTRLALKGTCKGVPLQTPNEPPGSAVIGIIFPCSPRAQRMLRIHASSRYICESCKSRLIKRALQLLVIDNTHHSMISGSNSQLF